MKDKYGHALVPLACPSCGKIVYIRETYANEPHYCRACVVKASWKKKRDRSFYRDDQYKKRQSEAAKQFHKNNPTFRSSVSLRGDNNPAWKHGEAAQGYKLFTETRKEEIRKRDNNICQICGEVWNGKKPRLDVHHIDYDKNNFSSENLVTVCRVCHSKTNYHRDQWIEFFKKRQGL